MHHRKAVTAALAAAALALGGCQSGNTHGPAYARADYPPGGAAIVASTDWSKTVDVVVELVEYGYRPRELRLKAGQPYRIRLINYSGINHYFTAPEFFRSAATRKAMVDRYAEIKAPYFTAFEVVSRGGGIDVYLVPMVKGRFDVHCEINDHRERGVRGVIIVE